jgi:hydrogenase maturation protease
MTAVDEGNKGPPAGDGRIVVIGTGNPFRGDDAAGVEFSRRFRVLAPRGVDVVELTGEPATVMAAWTGAVAVFVVDAVDGRRTGKPEKGRFEAGHIIRIEAHEHPLPVRVFRSSTHVLGVAEAIELARALGQLPPVLIVYGIVGRSFGHNQPVSTGVAKACETVCATVLEDIDRIRRADC